MADGICGFYNLENNVIATITWQIPGTVSISKFLRTCFLFSLFTTTQLYLIFVSTPSRLSCDCTGSVLQKVVFVNKIPKSNILSSSEVGVAETQWSILTCLSLCVTVYIVYVHVRRKQIDENRKENETFNTSDACQFSLTVFTCFEIKTHLFLYTLLSLCYMRFSVQRWRFKDDYRVHI